MSTNYLAVISCTHCGEMIITKPDGSIFCACTTKRSCKHPEGMGDCHECTIARLQARVEEAEQQLRDQVASDLGDYLEVIGRGVQAWNYMDMMLLPRMEGLAESLQASYEHTAKLEALAERRKEALDAWVRYSLSSKPSKELLVEALRLTDAAEEPR